MVLNEEDTIHDRFLSEIHHIEQNKNHFTDPSKRARFESSIDLIKQLWIKK